MGKMLVLDQMRKSKVSFRKQPLSYYSGGMENPCRLKPTNVLAFFSKHETVRRDSGIWYHQRYQVKINVGDDSILGIDEFRFKMKPDTGILIFPLQPHYVAKSEVPNSRLHLTITFDDAGKGEDSVMSLRNQPFAINRQDVSLLTKVIEGAQHLNGVTPGEAVASLEMFLARKLEEHKNSAASSDFLPEHPIFGKIFTYLRNHSGSPISIKDIAGKLQLSESYLRRLVRTHFSGLPLGTFLRKLRYRRAIELLLHSRMTIGQISGKCGYSDQFAFSRAFKKFSGLSPLEYRKQYRHGTEDRF